MKLGYTKQSCIKAMVYALISISITTPILVVAQPATASNTNAAAPVSVKNAVLTEILKALVSAVKNNRNGAEELSSLFVNAFVTESVPQTYEEKKQYILSLTDAYIYAIPQDVKDNFIQNLPFRARLNIFAEIGEMLLGKDDRPFNAPVSNICQWDLFILMIRSLLENEHERDCRSLIKSVESCLGIKDLWKIKFRLDKPEYYPFIPESLQKRMFTTNIREVNIIKNRIQSLTEK